MNVYSESEIDAIAAKLDAEEDQIATDASDALTHAILAAFAAWGPHARTEVKLGLTMHDVMASMRWPDMQLAVDDSFANEVKQFASAYGWPETLRCLARAMDIYTKEHTA